jgi:ubiquinone/menaquinone biosynthesis C-methylase UbiE
LLELLIGGGYVPLASRKILDVGCGDGKWLETYRTLGADPKRLAGIDLVATRIEAARCDHPEADLRVGSAGRLPWDDCSFDLVSQYTAFTSILDPDLRSRSLVRVLKPGGAVLWCDFVYNNPFNPNVRGIRKTRSTRSSEMGVPASACMAKTTSRVW